MSGQSKWMGEYFIHLDPWRRKVHPLLILKHRAFWSAKYMWITPLSTSSPVDIDQASTLLFWHCIWGQSQITRLRAHSHEIIHTLDANHKSQVLTCASDQSDTDLTHNPCLDFHQFYRYSAENTKKHFSYCKRYRWILRWGDSEKCVGKSVAH